MQAGNRIQIASLGGKARARNLSPETRQDIARKAADAKWARRRGEPTHDEFVERLVGKIRAHDPVLARFVEIVSGVPFKDQETLFKALPQEKQGLVCRITEEIASCPTQ